MVFTPNYTKLGIETKEQAIAHVLGFLKKNEAAILKHGLSKVSSTSFTVLGQTFVLGDESHDGYEKPEKKKKSS